MKKVTPAKAAATKRYDAKTYDRRMISLRIKDDADIIAAVDELIAKGMTTSEAFKHLIRKNF